MGARHKTSNAIRQLGSLFPLAAIRGGYVKVTPPEGVGVFLLAWSLWSEYTFMVERRGAPRSPNRIVAGFDSAHYPEATGILRDVL